MAKSIIFGAVRCIYPSLDKPRAFGGGDESTAKYKITILVPKKDKAGYATLEKFIMKNIAECAAWKEPIKKQVFNIAKKTVGEEGLNNNCILRDGDELNEQRINEDKAAIEAYSGHWVITLNRRGDFGAPAVYYGDQREVPAALIPSVIMGGYWVNVEISAYCYQKPKAGITLQLQAVQFVRKDEVFGRQCNFDTVEGADEDSETSFDDSTFADDEVEEKAQKTGKKKK